MTRPCANPACGKDHDSRRPFGWCDGCYQRWLGAGKPEGGPPPHRQPSKAVSQRRADAVRAAVRRAFDARLAEYRRYYSRHPDEVAARHMRVTTRTIQRYRRIIGTQRRMTYPERLAEFRRMTMEGVPAGKIAEVLRVDQRTVRSYRETARAEGWLP